MTARLRGPGLKCRTGRSNPPRPILQMILTYDPPLVDILLSPRRRYSSSDTPTRPSSRASKTPWYTCVIG